MAQYASEKAVGAVKTLCSAPKSSWASESERYERSSKQYYRYVTWHGAVGRRGVENILSSTKAFIGAD